MVPGGGLRPLLNNLVLILFVTIITANRNDEPLASYLGFNNFCKAKHTIYHKYRIARELNQLD